MVLLFTFYNIFILISAFCTGEAILCCEIVYLGAKSNNRGARCTRGRVNSYISTCVNLPANQISKGEVEKLEVCSDWLGDLRT